jgi:flagellar motor switch protein FliM
MSAQLQEKDAAASWLKDARHDAPSLPIEKMPQLNASLERFGEALGESLVEVCGPGGVGATERISTTTTFELFGAYRGHAVAVLRSRALDARALMVFGNETIAVLLNAIFGLDPGVDPASSSQEPSRERTALENQMIAGLARTLIGPLVEAFAPVASFDLGLEKLLDIVDENLLGAKEMASIMAQYQIKTRGGAFRLIVVLPQNLTAPLGDMFARGPDPNAVRIDPQWTRLMEQGVTRAKLNLTAILDEFQMSLGEVAGLRAGSLLPLSAGGDGHVRIECVERGVFLCRLGERGDRFALEIEDIIANAAQHDAYAPD